MLPEDLSSLSRHTRCQVCYDSIQLSEVAQCPQCSKLMCEDCHVAAQFSCQVCANKLEQNGDFDFMYNCRDCMKRCKACGVVYHDACKVEHQVTCNPMDRARRHVSLANNQVRLAKLNLDKAKKELHDAKMAKMNAEKRLRQLQRSP